VVKRTDLSISKQPRYLRNRQVGFAQIALGEIAPQRVQHFFEALSFRRQSARKGSGTHPKLSTNLRHFGLAMREQFGDCIFYLETPIARYRLAIQNRLVAEFLE